MPTLADIWNIPTEFDVDGEKFLLRKPNQLEQGMFQRWLEQLAYDGINGRKYQTEAEKERALSRHEDKCSAGHYEWGSEVATQRLLTPPGLAKLIAIVARDQGMSDEKALKLVEREQNKAAAHLISKVTSDPKSAEVALAVLGLQSDFLSSNSATAPSEAPPTSSPSAECPTTN